MTNPFGEGRQPNGLGDPGARGPQFLPPTTPSGYGYGPPQMPPPPYQPPTPQPQPQPFGPPPGYVRQPGGQSYPPSAPPYQPPYQPPASPSGKPSPSKRSQSGVLVVVAVLVTVAALLVGGIAIVRAATADPTVIQPTPTRPAATKATASGSRSPTTSSNVATCKAGDKITTDEFVATVPASWACDGDDGDVSLSSARFSAMWVDHESGVAGVASCRDEVEGLGTITQLADERWGGVAAVGFEAADGDDIFGIRCVAVGGKTWYLSYIPLDAASDAGVRADVTTIMKTWLWK